MEEFAKLVGFIVAGEEGELFEYARDECWLIVITLNKIRGYLLQQSKDSHLDAGYADVGVVHQHQPNRIQRVDEVTFVCWFLDARDQELHHFRIFNLPDAHDATNQQQPQTVGIIEGGLLVVG